MAINLATFSKTTKTEKAFFLGYRPGITGGFIGSHGLRVRGS
jgi:hypothetical protein